MSYAHSYSRVTAMTLIRRQRVLPRPGDVLIEAGRLVKPTEVVARAIVPQEHRFVDVAKLLRVPPDRVERHLLKKVGDDVRLGETIAARRALLGLRNIRVTSPVTGAVKAIVRGRVLLEGEPQAIEVRASVPGRVVRSELDRGVVVETYGALIQAAWGQGDPVWGVLKVIDPNEEGLADPTLFNIDHRGAIVVISASLNERFIRVAAETRVRALISGSADASLIPMLREMRYSIALTQGFGRMPMSDQILKLLRAYNGREIALDPGTSEGWRAARPEIIIPLPAPTDPTEAYIPGQSLGVGQRVRVLAAPWVGEIGRIVTLQPDERCLESGLWLRGAEIELSSGQVIFVPFANLEHLG